MHCVLFAESAVLLCLHSLRMVLFLFCHVVITLFAFSTCQCDFYAHDFHLHCVFALSLVILADQRRSLHFCPVFAARTSAISGIKKRPSSMSLVYYSIRTASCQQNSPKYAENFYQCDSARKSVCRRNHIWVTHPIWNMRFSSGC